MDTYGITVVRNVNGDSEAGQAIILDLTGDAAMVLSTLTPLHQRMTQEAAGASNGQPAPVNAAPTAPANGTPTEATEPKRRGRPRKSTTAPAPVTAPAATNANPFAAPVG